jgi:hypothetical protein
VHRPGTGRRGRAKVRRQTQLILHHRPMQACRGRSSHFPDVNFQNSTRACARGCRRHPVYVVLEANGAVVFGTRASYIIIIGAERMPRIQPNLLGGAAGLEVTGRILPARAGGQTASLNHCWELGDV